MNTLSFNTDEEESCKLIVYNYNYYKGNDKDINNQKSKTNFKEFDSLQTHNQLYYIKEISNILDSYEFGKFHLYIIIALGTTWVLDGYEVSLVSSLSEHLKVFDLEINDVGLMGFFYLAGAVLGALLFGFLAVKYGRRKLFQVTLIIYI